MDYESTLRVHLVPFFGPNALDEIDVDLIERFISREAGRRQAPPSRSRTTSASCTRSSRHGMKRGWCSANPVAARRQAALPAEPGHPLSRRSKSSKRSGRDPNDRYGTDRPPALPHRRDDRHAARRGGRRSAGKTSTGQLGSFASGGTSRRGEFGTPKSRRSSRAVPLASRLATELEQHYAQTPLQARSRPRLRPSTDRNRPRSFKAAEAIPECGAARGRTPRPVPRPPAHVRHTDGRGGRSSPRCPGMARATATTARR